MASLLLNSIKRMQLRKTWSICRKVFCDGLSQVARLLEALFSFLKKSYGFTVLLFTFMIIFILWNGDSLSDSCLVYLYLFSLSKEFVDTHSLVTHAFNSSKVGLRTDHLGFHKALCVMMGWNSLMTPDNARAYQSLPSAEASVLKEDLILWPPLVVIHNSSIGKKNAIERVVVTNERMAEILRGLWLTSGFLFILSF